MEKTYPLICSRAPLRLGLAGGGTDVSPYCDRYGGAVLNSTIDRYAYVSIRVISDPLVRFIATDLQLELTLDFNPMLQYDGVLELHVAAYNYVVENFNDGVPIPIELTTFCDAPVGSGLGSSSTLVVAMIRAYAELLRLPLDDYAIARASYQVERVDCKLQGGRQDQYSAAFGGFNFMEFYAEEGVIVNPLRLSDHVVCELESSLLLYFTGVSRESSRIIADQSQQIVDGSEKALAAMHKIKQEAISMKECLLCGNFEGLVSSLQQGWESKKRSAPTVTNTFIDLIYREAIDAGALAGKVSGAGGGGFMLFFVPLKRRMDVISKLKRYGGEISNCHFTRQGVQAWKIN